MSIPLIWRGLMSKYKIKVDEAGMSVHILLPHCSSSLEAFIDVYIDDEDTNDSIFKNIEDAKVFAEIIVKLLEAVHDIK